MEYTEDVGSVFDALESRPSTKNCFGLVLSSRSFDDIILKHVAHRSLLLRERIGDRPKHTYTSYKCVASKLKTSNPRKTS